MVYLTILKDFPSGSVGKESTCNVGDLESILQLGGSSGGGHGSYASQCSHSSILAWRIPMDRRAWQATVHGVAKSWTQLSN